MPKLELKDVLNCPTLPTLPIDDQQIAVLRDAAVKGMAPAALLTALLLSAGGVILKPPPGFTAQGEASTYDRKTIFDAINGSGRYPKPANRNRQQDVMVDVQGVYDFATTYGSFN